ncbi:hypothetical protein LFYK43_00520 [Ligilactobacillus salitolerans]|uniref:Uncharacterized protein n=1 Tax=Ligilactobacillus salitolerans TaxID=1808352 RepID=A0A401IQ08_9LACO|nr:hypothetical protein LFYK43_00520 [Ligilactobacillus salitolerans]
MKLGGNSLGKTWSSQRTVPNVGKHGHVTLNGIVYLSNGKAAKILGPNTNF